MLLLHNIARAKAASLCTETKVPAGNHFAGLAHQFPSWCSERCHDPFGLVSHAVAHHRICGWIALLGFDAIANQAV